MKYVDSEEIIDHLSSEMRRAPKDAVHEVTPSAVFDEKEFFRAFKKAVRRKCTSREEVPDKCGKE